jgi:drug/metabolite transporter (DMT)-like permease
LPSGRLAPVSAPTRSRHPRRGYALAMTAATLWAANGSMSRGLLDDGLSPYRLAELRIVVSWLVIVAVLAAWRPELLRVRRADLPQMLVVGVPGLAVVQASYFVAIDHLQVGAALTIQYLAPTLILLWLRFVHGRRLRPALWAAAGASVVGCFFVVRAYDAGSLSGLGLAGAAISAVSFAIYLTASEKVGHRYAAPTTLAYGFGFATVVWLILTPLWSFPVHQITGTRHLALAAGVAIAGTLIPFVLMLAAVRHIPASRAGVVATLEPVLAAVIAWPALGESLAAIQIAGGLLVVAAVIRIQQVGPSRDAAGNDPELIISPAS